MDFSVQIIAACCRLHNLLIDEDIPEPSCNELDGDEDHGQECEGDFWDFDAKRKSMDRAKKRGEEKRDKIRQSYVSFF